MVLFFIFTMFLIVVLQAIVYSLLLLFIHPRPEPRTQSLIETVMPTLILMVYGGFYYAQQLHAKTQGGSFIVEDIIRHVLHYL